MKFIFLKCILKCIINILNHLKMLNSHKMSCLVDLFNLKSFHGFVSPAQLEYVTNCLSSLLLYIIVLFIMVSSSKSIQKISTCSRKNTQIQLNNITQIFRRKNISFLFPPSWLEGEIFKGNCGGNQNGMMSFYFHFLTISSHGN